MPTRELAFKVAEDAEELLFKTPYKVQTLVGGRSERYEQKQLAFERHEVLVAVRFALSPSCRYSLSARGRLLAGLLAICESLS